MSPPGRSGKSMPRLLLRSVFSCPSVIFYLRLSSWQFAEFTTSSADHCYMVQLFTVSRGLTVTTSAQACLGCCWLVLQAPAERLFFSPVHVRLLLSVPFLFQATVQPVSTGLASSTLSYVLLGLWRTAHKRICIGCLCVGKYLHKHSTVIPTLDCTFHHHQNQKMEYLLEEMY